MNTGKFRFTFALLIASVLAMAVLADMAQVATAADTLACPDGVEGKLPGRAEDGGGGDLEVRWSSLIPGSFK